jgi:hypothetical protein
MSIFNWYKDRKDRKIFEESLKEHERLIKSRASAEKQVEESTDRMLRKFCPIFHDLCHPSCIHYRAGHVNKMEWIEMQTDYYAFLTKCKLWKE